MRRNGIIFTVISILCFAMSTPAQAYTKNVAPVITFVQVSLTNATVYWDKNAGKPTEILWRVRSNDLTVPNWNDGNWTSPVGIQIPGFAFNRGWYTFSIAGCPSGLHLDVQLASISNKYQGNSPTFSSDTCQ
jgi:hypothetical protein